jgi:hypothetical protein
MAKIDDWRPGMRGMILVALGLATGTAVVQHKGADPIRDPIEASASAASAPEERSAGGLDATRSTIALIASFLGVDLADGKPRSAALALRQYLRWKAGEGRLADQRALAALDVLIGDQPARSSEPALSREDALRLLGAYSLPEVRDTAELLTQRQTVLEHFGRGAGDWADVARLEARAHARGFDLQFLVATLPDYVDSHTSRLFDLSLSGVQRAATALGYTLDRFYLPDWDPRDTRVRPRAKHEREPGAVLFRRGHQLLLVLIVTETPTGGLHLDAFAAATELVTAWRRAGCSRDDCASEIARQACCTGEPLPIVGPTFSGTAVSLRLALDALSERTGCGAPARIHIRTGTATDPSNRDILTANARLAVTFDGTVRNTTDVMTGLYDYLVAINPRWAHGAGVALLVESNTAYGQSFSSPTEPERPRTPIGGRCDVDETRNVEATPNGFRIYASDRENAAALKACEKELQAGLCQAHAPLRSALSVRGGMGGTHAAEAFARGQAAPADSRRHARRARHTRGATGAQGGVRAEPRDAVGRPGAPGPSARPVPHLHVDHELGPLVG